MPTAEATQAQFLAHDKEPHDANQVVVTHAAAKSEFPMRSFVDAFTILLALVSIVFAFVQELDSKDLKSKTALLVSGATTRYIAEFPYNIPGITDIVQGGCEQIDIMTDVPGYGQYSAPSEFYKYLSTILDQAHSSVEANVKAHHCEGKDLAHKADGRSPSIRLLLFSPELQREFLYRQFPREQFLADLKNPHDATQREKFLEFFRKNPDLLDGRITPEAFLQSVEDGPGYAQFAELVLDTHRNHEKDLRRAGVQIRYTSQPFIMRLWLQDDEEAAFSFDHSEETEITFRTRDTKLLDDFKRTFEEQWKHGVDYSTYWNSHTGS